MRPRVALDHLVPAALLAGAAVLATGTWFAFADVRGYLDSGTRVERLREAEQKVAAARHSLDAGAAEGRSPSFAAPGDAAEPRRSAQNDASRQLADAQRLLDVESTRAGEHRTHASRSVTLLALLIAVLGVGGGSLVFWLERQCRRLRRQLDADARHDPLTGLPGRGFLDAWLGYALAQARRDETHVGLLCIGLDGLADDAEPRAHKERERVLREVARRFRATARDADVLARHGSDAFVLAVPGIRDGHTVGALARRLIASLRDPECPPVADLPIGASIGVAFFPHDAGDVEGLLAAAADAMYVARRSGRNRAVFSAAAAFA